MASATPAGKTILIADDDRAVRGTMAAALARVGYRVIEAGDGQEALDALRNEGIDLLLLEMLLPVTDGWGVLAAKRADPALDPVPAVIVTGLGIASRSWALSLGAVGFLRKPVNLGELLKEVRRLC